MRVWFCNRRQTERKLQNPLAATGSTAVAGIAASLASLEEAQREDGVGDSYVDGAAAAYNNNNNNHENLFWQNLHDCINNQCVSFLKVKVTGTVINKQLDNFLLAALGVKLDLKDAALKQIATRRKNELLPSVTKWTSKQISPTAEYETGDLYKISTEYLRRVFFLFAGPAESPIVQCLETGVIVH